MRNPLVSVVVLNWNGGTEVLACIEHVMAQSYHPVELVVVDNASVDGSKEMIRNRFPGITLLENQRNLGFATGMNQGIELAKGEFILLLNQDAWIRDDFVENAVCAIDRLPFDVGMLAGRVYRLVDHQKTDKLIGGGILLRRRFQMTRDPDFCTEHYTFSPIWCSPFLRKAMLDDVMSCSGHYFDDRYFAYGEDLDLALRAQLRGWRCVFVPDLVSWHVHSGSLGGKVRLWEKPPIVRKYALRNRYLTIIKDLPLELILYLAPFMMLAEVAAWPFFLFRSPRTILCLIQAWRETVQALPEILRLRHKIQTTRKVSIGYLRQFLYGS